MATPEFQSMIDELTADLTALKAADPDGWTSNLRAKVARRILDVVLQEVPSDPGGNQFRQGKTLGGSYKHWRRAKFLGRYRLFFRYDATARIIIYAWNNDASTLRKAGSRNDPYTLFASRLAAGDPPNDWADLLNSAKLLKTQGPEAGAPKR